MKVAVACDHGGFTLKPVIIDTLKTLGVEVADLGTDGTSSVDYPDYAHKAVEMLLDGACDRIVLICGTGIGMSIFANRCRGVRAALCHDGYTARMSRQHNDANCLVLGARVTGPGIAAEIVEVWMNTPFEGGRHAARLSRIEELSGKIR
ncbi:MAG TPA: ribose 5-phosphate isomerase B [Deltaproteobacteria bacterium]|nr:ribose 5-phosphate isomerase B [Deltaproteobacteria bacterium]HPR54580.1 ribose 5-phosphate isomerase B [Deltaproteobacteria bacterium]HXK48010.1 ribose 5-phosphate isomerase B [Deltaproteobacteria bacterium]